MNLKRWLSVGDLTLAASFWGFGFIATVYALKVLNPFEINLLRFALAAALGFPFLFMARSRANFKFNARKSFWPSVLLCGTLILQTWGLNYTTATKSGFITTLYVVMVPVLDSVISRRRISWRLWFFIFLAFLGTAFILNVGFAALNTGDILTLMCAVVAAFQIYWVGIISPGIRAPFGFNVSQCWWSLLLSLPFCLWGDGGRGLWAKVASVDAWPTDAVFGIVFLGVGSSLIAFFLQVRGQAGVSPTVGSIICLLESPFAMIFAFLALGHVAGGWELLGALMIFIAAVGASLNDAPKVSGAGTGTGIGSGVA